VRELGTAGLSIEDPVKLLKWLARDRASVRFNGQADLEAKEVAFENLMRSWIKYV
jgi:hypothetical protein